MLVKTNAMTECSRSFSLKEEEHELAWSTKKVKDSHNRAPIERNIHLGRTNLSSKLSFRDKLVGEIPSAYSQAFAFWDHMDAESESDEETKKVKEGMVAISLSKETKQHIRAP